MQSKPSERSFSKASATYFYLGNHCKIKKKFAGALLMDLSREFDCIEYELLI